MAEPDPIRDPRPDGPRHRHTAAVVALLFVLLTLGVVGARAPLALATLLLDGGPAVVILLGATGWGMLCLRAFEPHAGWPLRWHAVGGAGLGVGLLAVGVLVLGSVGLLWAPLWWALLGAGILLGARRWQTLLARADEASAEPAPWSWGWLLLVPSAALVLLCATVPPGVLWAEEAHGYDVLEYHLQVPREFFEAGAVTALPHNLYSYFPLNAEMLYLLAMVLRGDPLQAAITAKLVNAGLALLFVAAAWLAGREHGASSGLLAALLAGSTPWLAYLSGVAFVENGMLLEGMLAAAALLHLERRAHQARLSLRVAALAGVFAGLAAGFKYIALPMIVLALAAGWIVAALRRRWPGRWEALVLFLLGAGLACSPWLVRNGLLARNPVFPLVHPWLGAAEELWTPELAERWAAGHRVEPRHDSAGGRLALLWTRVLRDDRLGWGTLLLAGAVLCCAAPRRSDLALLAVLAVQVGVWAGFTHLFARFAVPLLIPLVLLATATTRCCGATWRRAVLPIAVLAALGVHGHRAWTRYAGELAPGGQALRVHGMTEWFYDDQDIAELPVFLRRELPADSRVLLVGEARAFYLPANVDYCVVFSRNPFAEAVAASSDERQVLHWLRQRGYTHLVVNWNEMARLRQSYGFWEELDAALFQRLASAGLRALREFQDGRGRVYATCFALPQAP